MPRTHGVREFRRGEGAAAAHAEEVELLGYTVVADLIPTPEIEALRGAIDEIYESQVAEHGGEGALRSIDDADIARCPLAYDDRFVELAAHEAVLEIVRALLEEHVVLMSQNGIINRSTDDHYQLAWHRDLNYQHFVSTRPLAISALWCIDEFTAQTGGTQVVPGSHKIEAFPSPAVVERRATLVEASPGSVVIFDAMLFHRAGQNRSGSTRRAVNHIYTRPMLQQQISLPSALNGRFADDPRLATLLGYTFEPGVSAADWRNRKLAARP